MARYRASIETQWTPDEAFAYLSDFSTSAEWDPGVVEAERSRRRNDRGGNRVSPRGRVPGAKDAAQLSDRRIRAAERRHVRGRERDRHLARPHHLRDDRHRDAGHLRRRPQAEGPAQARRSAPRAGLQPGRRPGAGRTARGSRTARSGDGSAPRHERPRPGHRRHRVHRRHAGGPAGRGRLRRALPRARPHAGRPRAGARARRLRAARR